MDSLLDIAVVCTICNDTSKDTEIIETQCRHQFHKACLSSWLDSNETCPICRHQCSKAILNAAVERRVVSNPPSEPSYVPSAGAVPKGRMQTRSQGRGTPHSGAMTSRGNPRREPKAPESTVASEDRINRLISDSMDRYRDSMSTMISEQITSALRNLRLPPSARETRDDHRYEDESDVSPSLRRASNATRREDSFGARPSGIRVTPNNSVVDRPDRISNTISNWRIKFTGSPNDLPLEDFIFRVNCMTSQSLNGNFGLLSQFAHLLFSGPALSFYWRVHRTVRDLDWYELCSRLQERYQDQRTDRDIKDAMRRRKQGSNESFDEFLDAMLSIADSLREPMSDSEIAVEVRYNLRAELQHELLHIDTSDLASLRRECHRHEEFLRSIRPQYRSALKRSFVNSLQAEEKSDSETEEAQEAVVCAIRSSDNSKCWNCEEPGHRYHDCLQARRVFCYGCGAVDVYKPNCEKCKTKSENSTQDVRRFQRGDVRR